MSKHHHPRSRLAPACALTALLLAGSAASAVAAADTGGASASAYTYETRDYPGAANTIIWGINDFGDLAGQYNMSGQPAHAMVYRFGRFERLDPQGLFGDNFSAAGGPNDLGVLYGAYADASGTQHGFILRRHHVRTVDFANHLNSNVDCVNVFGDVAGVYWEADGVFHGVVRNRRHDTEFDVTGALDTYPLGINNDGAIVGYWDTTPGSPHGFYRTAKGLIFSLDEPDAGAGGTVAFAINDAGQVDGYFADASGHLHGFVQSQGQYQVLDVPGALATVATTINNYGVVAGEYFDATGARHGFVATPVQ